MAFLLDSQELKAWLISFRRGDVKHRNGYRHIKCGGAPKTKNAARVANTGGVQSVDLGCL
jgi:hypothetical protein